MTTFLKVFSSLWLTFPLLGGLAFVLACGSGLLSGLGFDFIDVSIGALRLDVFGSPWFAAIMVALMVNLTACTIHRKPWKFWQWGYLVTHTGILTLMIGSIVTFYFKTYGQMPLREGQDGNTFAVENERELQVWINANPNREKPDHRFPLDYNLYRRTTPSQVFPTRDGIFIRVEEHLPHVEERERYVPAPGGRETALEVEPMDGARARGRVFIPAGMVTGYGPLEIAFERMSEEAVENMLAPAGEQGTLWVRIDGEEREIDIARFMNVAVPVGKAEVVVKELIEIPPGQADPFPIVKFEVRRSGSAEMYGVAALRPEAGIIRERDQERATDFDARLRVNLKMSRLWVVLTPKGLRGVALSSTGGKKAVDAGAGTTMKYPFMQMPFELKVHGVIENAMRVPVETAPRKEDNRRPAVRLRVTRGEAKHEMWLTFGGVRSVEIGGDRLAIGFMPREFLMDFSVRLDRVRAPTRPGQRRAAMRFESDMTVFDPQAEGTRTLLTGVNYPATHRGYVFYQSQVTYDEQNRPVGSVFQVAWDPGKKIIYLGGIMAISGSIFMFFLKGFLLKLVRRADGATDAPLREAQVLGVLTLCSLGTLIGSALMFLRVPWTGVAVGFSVAGLDLVIAVLACHAAWRMTPGRAVQVGQAISLTWVLNSFALVLFMWMKVLG